MAVAQEPISEVDYLRMIVQLKLSESGYKPFYYFIARENGFKKIPSNLTREEIEKTINLWDCVEIDWYSMTVFPLDLHFFYRNFTLEDLETYNHAIYCR